MTQWGLDTLFNPAKRHMDDEKRRLQSTREEVGDSSGGKRIDLESGKVVIHREDDDDAPAAGELAEAAAPETDKPKSKAKSKPEAKETPAQARARARQAAAKAARK